MVPAVISWEKCGQTNTLLELVSVRSDLVIATPLQPWWFFLNLLFCFLQKKSFMKVCRISADYRNITSLPYFRVKLRKKLPIAVTIVYFISYDLLPI